MPHSESMSLVVPGPFEPWRFAGKMKGLVLRRETPDHSGRPFAVLDCFDQSLRKSGRLLAEFNGELILLADGEPIRRQPAARQGNDVGLSYRSAIYYVDEDQKAVAEDTIADVNASGLWPGPVVTEVEPVGDFWEAEPEHQDYLERIPNGYTCHFPRPDWVLPKRAKAS